jgi:hypothetical protein
MKKLIFSLSILAISGLAITSCKKTSNTTSIPSTSDLKSRLLTKLRNAKNDAIAGKGYTTGKTTTDYSNSQNPYEWVGINHNNDLAYIATFMSNLVDDHQTLTLTIREPLTDNVLNGRYNTFNDKVTALSQKFWNENVSDKYVRPYVAQNSVTNASEKSTSNDIISYLSTNKFVDPRTDGLNKFNEDLYGKLEHWVQDGTITQFDAQADSIVVYQVMETDSVEQSIAIIKTAEDDIINSQLDDETKTRQLVFLSILRNSIGYWVDVMQDNNSPWQRTNGAFINRVGTHEGYAKFSWHAFWGAVLEGVADAVGGIAGAGGGPIVSGIAGGVASGVVAGLWP